MTTQELFGTRLSESYILSILTSMIQAGGEQARFELEGQIYTITFNTFTGSFSLEVFTGQEIVGDNVEEDWSQRGTFDNLESLFNYLRGVK